jgi:ABC-type multidrug transport system fused ATPase/permease subunit
MSSEYVSQGEIPLNTYQITALEDQIKNTSSCTALQQIIEQAINSVTSLISGIIQTQLDILADFFPILNIPGPNPFAIVKWIRKLVFGTAVTQYLAYIQYAIQLIDLSAALSSLITAIQEAISLSGCIMQVLQ